MITAAGIALAGVFLVLASTPVVFLVETGTAIAIGVLLDTFIVRSVLVPALSLDIGRRVRWPWQEQIPADPPEGARGRPAGAGHRRSLSPRLRVGRSHPGAAVSRGRG